MENIDKEITGAIVITPTVINQITKAEIDVAISTARAYPRNLTQFKKRALSMATLDATVAASCFYKLKRKNKQGGESYIEGPSIRFAEIVGAAYGNLRFGSRTVDEGAEFVTAQGVAHDLENNVSVTTEVRRRITTAEGRRYSTDMIVTTANAAGAIALRNAIFKAVPFSLAKEVFDAAKKTAIGTAATLAERRQKMIIEYGKMTVTPEMIFRTLEIKGMDDISLEKLDDLIGIYNAIKDGDTTIDEQFGDKSEKKIKQPEEKTDTAPAAPEPTAAARAPLGDGLYGQPLPSIIKTVGQALAITTDGSVFDIEGFVCKVPVHQPKSDKNKIERTWYVITDGDGKEISLCAPGSPIKDIITDDCSQLLRVMAIEVKAWGDKLYYNFKKENAKVLEVVNNE